MVTAAANMDSLRPAGVQAMLAGMGLVVWYLPQRHQTFTVPVAAAVYFAVLALLRTFDAGDFRLLASLISNQPLAPAGRSVDDNGASAGH